MSEHRKDLAMTIPPSQGQQTGFLKDMFFGFSIFADAASISAVIASLTNLSSNLILLGLLVTSGLISYLVTYKLTKRWHISPVLVAISLLLAVGLSVSTWMYLSNIPVKPIQVEITNLTNGDRVEGFHSLVQGRVSDPHATVRVLVHPLAVAEAWIQDIPIVDSAGNWQVNAYFGEPGNGVNQDYEIIALATSENFLVTRATGNGLSPSKINIDKLPQNTNRSNTVTVTRIR
jgi:hypothetical protein